MLIIVDNTTGDQEKELIISDDGTGQDIQIPTIMISQDDGHKIIDFLMKQENLFTPVIFVQKFELNVVDDHPIYEIWLTNSDDSGLKFVEQFEEYHLRFNGNVTMIP